MRMWPQMIPRLDRQLLCSHPETLPRCVKKDGHEGMRRIQFVEGGSIEKCRHKAVLWLCVVRLGDLGLRQVREAQLLARRSNASPGKYPDGQGVAKLHSTGTLYFDCKPHRISGTEGLI